MNRTDLASLITPKHLQLIILPTEQCNFRCTYCYEDFEIGRMHESTVLAVKKLIDRRLPKLGSLALSWFGGEPLVAKDIVMELSGYAQRGAKENNVTFSSDMTTNGYTLSKATFASLLELDVRSYQVSLDGDEEEHNKTRKLASGKGSFSKIWSNLLAMRESNERFSIVLRIHVHADNVGSTKALMKKIHEAFGADARFSTALKEVGNWGGESVKQMNLLKRSLGVVGELNAYNRQLASDAPRVVSTAAPPVHACYAALPSSLVIRADGSLAKCTVAFNDPRNKIGKLNDDGSVCIENEAMHSFMRGFESMNVEELHCPIKNMPAKSEVQVIQFHKTAAAIA